MIAGFEPSTSLVLSHSPTRPNPNCFPQKNSFSRIFFIQQKVCLQVKTCPSLGVSFFALILASFCVSKSVSVSPVTRGYGILTLLSSHLISSQVLARDRERDEKLANFCCSAFRKLRTIASKILQKRENCDQSCKSLTIINYNLAKS